MQATNTEHHEGHHGHELSFIRRYIFSTDHKIIGLQFFFTAWVMMVVGGILALLIRWQLAYPDSEVPLIGRWLWPHNDGKMTPEAYVSTVTMHGSIMIFAVVIPMTAAAFGNYLIPLQIGFRDMAFPTLNMLSYWFMWPALICFIASYFVESGPAGSGWTVYPTLSVIQQAAPGSGAGQTLWFLGALFVGVSSMMGSVNYLTTIINCRAPGMTFFRLPMTTWSLFVTAILQAFALPVLTVALIMGLLDNLGWTSFFVPQNFDGNWIVNNFARRSAGGQPLLFQHLFWFYSHPAVYIMVLPTMGMTSDIIATHVRKPLFGYKPMVYSILGIAGLGFIVWGHHMFVSGMNPTLGTAFMVATIMIALPSSVKVFNWIFTLWGSKPDWSTPLLFALAFVAFFIIGGLSGIFMASTPTDIHIHDTYFIVAHFHFVIMLGGMFAIFAATYHWFPKMFGRKMNETLGKLHFVLSFIPIFIGFYLMHQVGLLGQPRRYADIRPMVDTEAAYAIVLMNKISSHSIFVFAAAQLIFVFNLFYSMFFGEKADRNPWRSNSLEWEAPSPPPHGNFERTPVVYRGPYEYSHPAAEQDYLPQTHPPIPGEEQYTGH